jgi:acetyl esterase
MWFQQAGSALAEGFFQGAARIGRLHPHAAPSRHKLELIRNIPYQQSSNPAHLLDIYRPLDQAKPLPVVLYLHGGGFRILSKDTHWLMGLAFGRRGYLVFNANYRLAGEARYPAAVEDVCAAYCWVREHAAEFGGDPDRIVLAGESAGANLAVVLSTILCWNRAEPFAAATFKQGAAPLAVAAACGVYQVSDIERLQRRKPKMARFVVDRLTEVEHAYLGPDAPKPGNPILDLADPAVFLEKNLPSDRPLPPFFLPVGTADPLLPDTRRLAAALQAYGAIAQARYYERELHAFHAFVFRKQARQCWLDTGTFLQEHVR